MGVIYRGADVTTGEEIAIKVMHTQHSSNKVYRHRFEQEAKAAMTLSHQNIVKVNDFGITENSVAYLIMEWVEGEDLGTILARVGRLSLDSFLDIFTQTANALAHSHSKGVIHRDIKPSNILITRRGRHDVVKIVDFGIAKVISPEGEKHMHLTQTGELVGSPMFMSPEQCSGKTLDNRSDIYSLGCVMYRALVGQPPLVADNSAQMFFKQITEMPARPSAIYPQLEMPQVIEPILFKTLQKDPAKRYRDMSELEHELASVQAMLAGTPNIENRIG